MNLETFLRELYCGNYGKGTVRSALTRLRIILAFIFDDTEAVVTIHEQCDKKEMAKAFMGLQMINSLDYFIALGGLAEYRRTSKQSFRRLAIRKLRTLEKSADAGVSLNAALDPRFHLY